MKFHIDIEARGDSRIYYENDDIKVCVGLIGQDGGKYTLHHGVAAAHLKPRALAEFKAFGFDQANLMSLTRRMLK